jgi:hypothetical protein
MKCTFFKKTKKHIFYIKNTIFIKIINYYNALLFIIKILQKKKFLFFYKKNSI